MTQEEFKKLPTCIRYKNPESDCRKLNSDDWDELIDDCQSCTGFKYFAKKYYGELFTNMSYDEVIAYMK